MALELFSHNEDAYLSALKMLDKHGKAAVIHPTGTGKSFIGFRLCEDFPGKTVCWISPSEYIFKIQKENLKKATGGKVPENIIFITYAKLSGMDDAEMAGVSPDYIILDEFHRCGAETWGAGVLKFISINKKAKILGLSATAIRYLDNQRDMARELFDGNIASEMTLGEALVRGILNPPKYVTSVFAYQKDLERIRSRVRKVKNKAVRDKAEEYVEALRRSLDMADGLENVFKKHVTDPHGKYIVFCTSLEHMRSMRENSAKWFAGIDPEPHIYTAYSNDPETSKAFDGFKNDMSDHIKLLYCIDMLNEGVHIDGVSGVVLLRPTVSPIVYKQQIGRALCADKKCVPVIFDIVNNIEGLCSIGTIEREMQAAVDYYRFIGEERYIVNERFDIIGELRDAKTIFDKLNDTLSASWDVMYVCAKEYYLKYGNLEVPRRYRSEEGYSLGSWIFTQRKVYAGKQYGSLSESRIKKLEDIGMIWDSLRDISWKKFYSEAEKYHAKKGDLSVPANYVSNSGVKLGAWISNLRTYRKSGINAAYLTRERIDALNEIGMIWDVSDHIWENCFAECKRYYAEHGDLDLKVTDITPDGMKIGKWIALQRKRRKSGDLTERQISMLDSVGMQWGSKYERAWDNGVSEAEKYYKEHGNIDVPVSFVTPSGFKLGDWISNRREYGRDKLSPSRRSKLDSMGMVWKKADPWEKRFELARKYYDDHGNLNIPSDYVTGGVWLARWLYEQKQILNGKRGEKRLTDEQKKKLDTIGIRG